MRRTQRFALIAAVALVVLVALVLLAWLLLPESWLESSPTLQRALDDVASLPYAQWGAVASEDASKLGVVAWDRERAFPGLNVFCLEGRPRGRVMDMEGRTVLRLEDPRDDPEPCRLLEPYGEDGFVMLTREGSVLLLGPRSGLRFADERSFHHDAVVTVEGHLMALSEELRYVPRIQPWKPIEDNLLLVVGGDGRLRERISFAEMTLADPALLEMARSRVKTYPFQGKDNVFNANSVEVIDRDVERGGELLFRRGQLLTCWRNFDVVGVIDPERRRFVWTWGRGELEHPHHPTLLPDGNVLIFDNGAYREWSRVVEVDPATGEIVWEYRADPPEAFYSKSRGSAQRLPNGNTLIAESERGRAFEVTPDGRVVWEFFAEEVREGLGGMERATIYRIMRVAEGSAVWARRPPSAAGAAAR